MGRVCVCVAIYHNLPRGSTSVSDLIDWRPGKLGHLLVSRQSSRWSSSGFIRRQETYQLDSGHALRHMENLNMTPKIAKNMSRIDAGISFSEMLQSPSRGNFSLRKLGLAKKESKEADVVL